MKVNMPKNNLENFLRWTLPGWLCRWAAWLRRERWYVAETWHGVPGNRAHELESRIWENVLLLSDLNTDVDQERQRQIIRDLNELAQAAESKWGHVWPGENGPNEV